MAIKIKSRVNTETIRKSFYLSSTAWTNLTALSTVLDCGPTTIINILLEEGDLKEIREKVAESIESRNKG